ncbi:matrilin-3-like [Argonauta hians]
MIRYLTIIMLFCWLLGAAHSLDDKNCSSKAADIYFLLDSSSSIWIQDYKQLLRFVSNVVDTFDIGTGQSLVRVGIITFSDTAHLDVPLNRYPAIATLKEAISRIPYRTGLTNTAAAMNLLRREILSDRNKHDGPIVAIVVTDGLSRDTKSTTEEAEKLHKLGVNVYAIGVGNRYEIEELKAIASDAIFGVYQVVSYSALEEIAHNFHLQPCQDLVSTTTTPTTTTSATTTTTTTTPPPSPTTTTAQTTPPPRPTRKKSPPKITIKTRRTQAATKKPFPRPTTTAEPTTTRRYAPTWTPPPRPVPTRRRVNPAPWHVPFWHNLHSPYHNAISFGFDFFSLGPYKTQMLYDFIANFLPISGYNKFSVVSQAYCPQSFNVPMTSILTPKNLRGGPGGRLGHPIKTTLTFPSLEDTVRRLRHDLFRSSLDARILRQTQKNTVVLFLEPASSLITNRLIQEIEMLKMQIAELFLISIGNNSREYSDLLNKMASDPSGYHVLEIPDYNELLSRIQHSPFQFRSLSNRYQPRSPGN